MYRDALLTQLNHYILHYPQESFVVERFKEFVDTHQDCFERTQLNGHVTGSAWLTNNSGTHVLLTHHRKLNRWLQLGGHADGNGNLLEVAIREAREESGIADIIAVSDTLFDIDIHHIPERTHEPGHFHYDARFALQVTSSDQFTVSSESHALEWVDISQLQSKTSELSIHRMAYKWMNNQRKQNNLAH